MVSDDLPHANEAAAEPPRGRGDAPLIDAPEIDAEDIEQLDPAIAATFAVDADDDIEAEDTDPRGRLAEPALSIGELTDRWRNEVQPRFRQSILRRGYLTLGDLAHTTVALQGNRCLLQEVRRFVGEARIPVLALRSHHRASALPLAVIDEAQRQFGDLVHGAPAEHLVVTWLGYGGLRLTAGARAFLMQAWLGHCLCRDEERIYLARIGREQQRAGCDMRQWSVTALAAREAIVLDNLRAVARVARAQVGQGIETEDLLQFGVLGLLRAIEKYDPAIRSERFVTYASSWIWQRVTRAVAESSRLIRLPVHLQGHRPALQDALADLRRERWQPSLAEVAARSGVAESTAQALLITSRSVSLDRPELRAQIEAMAVTREPTSTAQAETAMLRAAIEDLLTTLPERDAFVVRLRFGLLEGERCTLEDIGQQLGVTRERVRQIEEKALKKLRHPSRIGRLQEYADHALRETDMDDRPAQPAKPATGDLDRLVEPELPSVSRAALVVVLPRFSPHDRAILTVRLGLEALVPALPLDREAVAMAAPSYVGSLIRRATLMADSVMAPEGERFEASPGLDSAESRPAEPPPSPTSATATVPALGGELPQAVMAQREAFTKRRLLYFDLFQEFARLPPRSCPLPTTFDPRDPAGSMRELTRDVSNVIAARLELMLADLAGWAGDLDGVPDAAATAPRLAAAAQRAEALLADAADPAVIEDVATIRGRFFSLMRAYEALTREVAALRDHRDALGSVRDQADADDLAVEAADRSPVRDLLVVVQAELDAAVTAEQVKEIFRRHHASLGWRRLCRMWVLGYEPDRLFKE